MIDRQLSKSVALVLAFLIPILIILAANIVLEGYAILDQPAEEWPNTLFQIGIYVAPFLVFLLIGQRSSLLWAIQTGLIALVWAYFVWSVFASLAANAGVDFFAVFLTLFGPILTGFASFLLYAFTQRLFR